MAKCRSCGAEIFWAQSEQGKNIPMDMKPEMRAIVVDVVNDVPKIEIRETFVSHFVTCPDAQQWRKKDGN